MFLSRTSIAQRSPLCSRRVLTTDWLLADLCPQRSQNAALICNLHQNCSHTLFPAKLFFSSPSSLSERHQMFVKTSLSRMTGVLAGKELIGLIRCLDFRRTTDDPGWCYVPGNTRVQQTRGLDLLTGRIITAWHGLPWLLEHRNREGTESKCSDFNKIWEKHVCLFGETENNNRAGKMQSVWDNCHI